MNSLPPEPKIKIGGETIGLINQAEQAFLSISGILTTIPDNHPAIIHAELNETLSSMQIDGAEISYSNYLGLREGGEITAGISKYTESVDLGIRLLKNVPKASHIIKSIHQKLSGDSPERFRIHNRGEYPSPEKVSQMIDDLDNYILNDISYPVTINAALIHAQFEMIHPFDYLNGLVGRILAQLHFIWKNKMPLPILQISSSLLNRKAEYFELLHNVSKNNNWEDWIVFFLSCVVEAGEKTQTILKKFLNIERNGIDLLIEQETATTASLKLHKYFLSNPISSVPQITESLGLSKQTANLLITKFLELGLIEEATGKQRNRIYTNKNIINLFEQ